MTIRKDKSEKEGEEKGRKREKERLNEKNKEKRSEREKGLGILRHFHSLYISNSDKQKYNLLAC